MLQMKALKALTLAAAGLGAVAAGSAAQAATCGFTGTATGSGGVYDPFNPTGRTASIQLSIVRVDPPGAKGAKTAIVSLYLTSTLAAANGIQVIPRSVSVDGNVTFVTDGDVFYDSLETSRPSMGPPTDSTNPTAALPYLKIEFTGENAASNPALITFDVILPANLNLTSSDVISLDSVFRCTTTGGGPQTDQDGSYGGTVSLPITVLSALQASYAGTALDFGEIGTIDNATAPTINTGAGVGSNNYIRVQSSGAYQVTLTSQNGYRLKHPTGSLAVANEKVDYQLKFLGQTRNESNTATISQNCARAGLNSFENRLPLYATLREGGQGKLPSLGGTYQDTLTVTITPQDIGVTYPTNCASFTVP